MSDNLEKISLSMMGRFESDLSLWSVDLSFFWRERETVRTLNPKKLQLKILRLFISLTLNLCIYSNV